jgi:GntR family transcriptional regulator/MocR family aminotransferase
VIRRNSGELLRHVRTYSPRLRASNRLTVTLCAVSINWTGLGPELLLRLDRSLPEPLQSQLQRELRAAIRNGQLGPGERLPSSRALARELGVSRGLVLECYAQLQAEGFLTAHTGAATRVAAGAQTPVAVQRIAPRAPRLAVDFRTGVPDLTSFPRHDWAWALREGCRRASVADLDYGDPRGTVALREILAGYLRRVRRAVVDPEQIIVCAGFAQGINLVVQTLARSRIRQVGIEDPGDDDYRMIGRRSSIEAIAVPVDQHGIDVEALAATACRAVILTPTHQFPTGVALAPERRQALVTWANEHDAVIVEDDYDAEFRYDREPVGALQGLVPNRVALVGTVSKSLAPALRIGWVVCPPALLATMTEEKALMDRGSPAIEQLALAALIESGRFDRHLRRMRAVYAGRRETLVRTLATEAPSVSLHGLVAGFHAVARLPASSDERSIVEQARERSIELRGMSEYRASGAVDPPELVLGFGNLSDDAIERGIAGISDLLASPG